MQHRGYEYVCMGVGLCVKHVCVSVYVLYMCVYGCICVWVMCNTCVLYCYTCVCMGVFVYGLCVYGCICVWVMCYTCVCMGVCVIHVWVYLCMVCVIHVYGCMCMGTNPDMHIIKIDLD